MAMNGTNLGNAIGEALYDAIPASVKDNMSAAQKADMCNSLKGNW